MCLLLRHRLALILVHFQDLPTGYERVEDEGANVNHEAEEEEQEESVLTSNPDGEVRNQKQSLGSRLKLLWQAEIQIVPLSAEGSSS